MKDSVRKENHLTIGFPSRGDVFGIGHLIRTHAKTGALLSRSQKSIAQDLSNWVVAKDPTGRVVGCASLMTISGPMAEVRSVAVCPSMKGRGVGSSIMNVVCSLAKTRKFTILYAFTGVEIFFNRFGFTRIDDPCTDKEDDKRSHGHHPLWNPGNRAPRENQKVMVADTRSLDPKSGVPKRWPQPSSARRAPNAVPVSAKHHEGIHLPTRRQNARVHSR